MIVKVKDIRSCQPQKGERFFFDTNIWLYLYCPIGNYNRKRISRYADFLKSCLNSEATIYTSSLILSEFLNTYARLEFNILENKYPSTYKNYKIDFRNAKVGEKTILEIISILKNNVLKIAKKVDDHFKSIDINTLLDGIEYSDYNDRYYTILGVLENMTIVTDDIDFGKIALPINIVTANNKLL